MTLPNIKDMPSQSASQVKNKWGDVARQVLQSGSLAITSHSTVEMVILNAAVYQQLTEEIQAFKNKDNVAIEALTERFDSKLQILQNPNAAIKISQIVQSKGQSSVRPKAGNTY